MAEPEKFLFNSSFDQGAAPRTERAKRAKDLADAEAEREKEAMRAAAFEEGRAAGRQEAEQSAAQMTATTLTAVQANLEQLHAQRETIYQDMRLGAVRVALALVRKLFPEMARRNALGEIEALIERTLSDLLDEPRVVIRIHDQTLDSVRQHIEAITKRCGFDGDVVLLADADVQQWDCRVEWADGGLERDTERLWQRIEEASTRLFASQAEDQNPDAPTAVETEPIARADPPPDQPTAGV